MTVSHRNVDIGIIMYSEFAGSTTILGREYFFDGPYRGSAISASDVTMLKLLPPSLNPLEKAPFIPSYYEEDIRERLHTITRASHSRIARNFDMMLDYNLRTAIGTAVITMNPAHIAIIQGYLRRFFGTEYSYRDVSFAVFGARGYELAHNTPLSATFKSLHFFVKMA